MNWHKNTFQYSSLKCPDKTVNKTITAQILKNKDENTPVSHHNNGIKKIKSRSYLRNWYKKHLFWHVVLIMHSPADAVIHPYCALEEQKFVTKLSQKRTTEIFHHHHRAKLLLLYTLCYIRYYTGPLHPKKHNKRTMIWITEFCPKIVVYFKGQFWNWLL